MTRSIGPWWQLPWATIGVPFAAGLYFEILWRVGPAGVSPDMNPWQRWIIPTLLLISGMAAVFKHFGGGVGPRATWAASYAVVAIIASLFVMMAVSCLHGDCL